MTSDEERMALLAGRPLDVLDDDERAQVASWTRLLADDATWAEPAPDLEDLVVASIQAAPKPSRHRWATSSRTTSSWVRPLLAGLAAAAAIIAAVFLFSRDHGQDTFAAGELAGTDLASGASGRVLIYEDAAGFRIELMARDLPRFEDGRFYQAWLKGPDGSVPIGTFSEGNGEWVTLWSGVSPARYPTLTVTIEQPDGIQESSGQRVLAGETSS